MKVFGLRSTSSTLLSRIQFLNPSKQDSEFGQDISYFKGKEKVPEFFGQGKSERGNHVENATAMIWKLPMGAEKEFCILKGSLPLGECYAGGRFVDEESVCQQKIRALGKEGRLRNFYAPIDKTSRIHAFSSKKGLWKSSRKSGNFSD